MSPRYRPHFRRDVERGGVEVIPYATWAAGGMKFVADPGNKAKFDSGEFVRGPKPAAVGAE